jgi:hypothetical protein
MLDYFGNSQIGIQAGDLSKATLGGRFALRGCVLNYRTILRDMEILLDDLRRVARSLPTSGLDADQVGTDFC